MGSFAAGEIVLVPFPFSDLSNAKLRPAIVICNSDFDDIVLSQITSKMYDDTNAIKVLPKDCINGSLEKISYIRPLKLFTADSGIVAKRICSVSPDIIKDTKSKVIELINKN